LRINPKYTVKDFSNEYPDNEKVQEKVRRIIKARLMAGIPPDDSLKNIGKWKDSIHKE